MGTETAVCGRYGKAEVRLLAKPLKRRSEREHDVVRCT